MVCLLWPALGRVQAQDKKPSTVLVVRVPGDDNIVLRLRAELSSYRFRVVELPPAKRAEGLAQLSEERDAQAALRAKPEAMAVEVWVRSSAGGRTNEELVSAGPGRDPAVLAVRVTEAMRARGLALPPLTAAGGAIAAADSGRRGSAPSEAPPADAPKPSAATPAVETDDVEPARPTVLPPGAVRPTAPGQDPRRSTAESDRKPVSDRKADQERKPEPDRKTDADRKVEPERRTELERTGETERKSEPERKIEPARRPESDPKPEPGRKAEPERKIEPARRPESDPKPEPTVSKTQPRKATLEPDSPSEPEPEPEPEPETQISPRLPRSALVYAEVGPSGVWSPGTNRLGPALDVFVSVKLRPNQTSSISLVGLIPLLSTDLQTSDGNAIEVKTFGIGGFGDLHLPLGRVELNVGVGGMAMFSSILPVDSSPGGPVYPSDLPMERLVGLLGRVGASLVLTPDLRVVGSLMVGLTVSDLRLQVAGTPDGPTTPEVRWGRPLLFGTLSLELALPWDR